MPVPKQSPVFQLVKKFSAIRRQRPLLVPVAIVVAFVILVVLYSLTSSTNQPTYQVLNVDNDLNDLSPNALKLQQQPARKALNDPAINDGTDQTGEDEPLINESELRDAMTKSLKQARAKSSNVPVAALAQLQAELDAAIAAKRFERCVIIRDVMKAVEKQIADNVVVRESVDDYIGRIEHSLRATESEASETPTTSEEKDLLADEQQASSDIDALRSKINALEDEVRSKHRLRMLANRARFGNSQIKVKKMSQDEADSVKAGILAGNSDRDDENDLPVKAGIRPNNQQNNNKDADNARDELVSHAGIHANQGDDDDRIGVRAGIRPNRQVEDDDRIGVKAGIRPGDLDGHNHKKGFKSFAEAKAAADAAKARYSQRFARTNSE